MTKRLTRIPASELGVFRLEGEDALTFLQGQSTPDLRRLVVGQCVFGGFCNAQGRVIANGWFQRIEGGFRLVISRDLTLSLIKRLRMYVLRSKVTITDDSASSPVWLVREDQTQSVHEWRMDGPLGLALVAGSEQELDRNVETLHGDTFNLMLIQAGIPLVTVNTTERYIPHMLSMDRLGSLSFDKGCYTGQEIVTRTQFLGKVKRTLHRLSTDDSVRFEVGSSMTSPASEEPIGELFSWAMLPNGGGVGLAIIKDEAVSGGKLALDNHLIDVKSVSEE